MAFRIFCNILYLIWFKVIICNNLFPILTFLLPLLNEMKFYVLKIWNPFLAIAFCFIFREEDFLTLAKLIKSTFTCSFLYVFEFCVTLV